MNSYLIIISLILLFFSIMISISININYDILNNIGIIKIFIFKMPILKSRFNIVDEYLRFSNSTDDSDGKIKVINVKLDINDISFKFFQELSIYIKQKILPMNLNTNVQICLENAFAVSMISGLINIIGGIYLAKIRLDNKDLIIQNKIESGYRHNIVKVDFNYKFSITIFDLIWSLVRSYIVIRRRDEKRV